VTIAALEAANQLSDSSILQLGRRLTIPNQARCSGRACAAVRLHVARAKGRASATATGRQPSDFELSRVVWAATHGGSATPAFPGVTPYAVAVRALRFEGRITTTALRYLGVPYAWGGTSFGGVDCSGFVWSVFHRNGIELPRMADEQFAVSRRVSWHAMRPGDLVFFQTYTSGISHVGIYLGRGRFIHASASNGVRVDSLGMDYYAARFLGAGRAGR
jgi:cell wall-associated NlpC family hydrolase